MRQEATQHATCCLMVTQNKASSGTWSSNMGFPSSETLDHLLAGLPLDRLVMLGRAKVCKMLIETPSSPRSIIITPQSSSGH